MAGGRCGFALRVFLGALAARFGISAGGLRRGSGAYASGSSPSSVKLPVSNHWKMLTFRSSIAEHPARPTLADKVNETSATRAQLPNRQSPSVARVSIGPDARVTSYGCRGVNSLTYRALHGRVAFVRAETAFNWRICAACRPNAPHNNIIDRRGRICRRHG
jgi:hypothetical protein